MSNDIIDINIHGSAFPTTYIGSGTLIGNTRYAPDADMITGYFTSDGNGVDIPCGFEVRNVEIVNVTDVIEWEWMAGFPTTDTVKQVTAGTTTIDTTTGISVVTSDGRSTVSLSAAAAGTSKLICFKIMG